VIKSVIDWRVDGDELAKTIHYWSYSGGAPSGADLSSFATALVANGDADFGDLTGNTIGMNSAEVTDLASDTGHQASAGTPWVGTRGAGINAPGVAILVNHSIARRYRGGKPRTYLPLGIASDLTTAGVWSNTLVGEVSTGWGGWVADAITTYGSLTITNIVNVSYYSGFTVVTSPTTGRSRNVPKLRTAPIVNTLTGHTVSAIVASQRRRNRAA
jgi:hypothetical protein